MDLKENITQLIDEVSKESYEKLGVDLRAYGGMNELSRWKELTFHLLDQINKAKGGKDPQYAVDVLHSLNLLNVDRLAAIKDLVSKEGTVVVYVLTQSGYSEEEASRAAWAIIRMAKYIKKKHGGRTHEMLVPSAAALRADIVEANYDENGPLSLNREQLSNAVTIWLQDIFGIPIPSDDSSIKKFCFEQKIKSQDLVKAANELDMNLQFIEYVLRTRDYLENMENGK